MANEEIGVVALRLEAIKTLRAVCADGDASGAARAAAARTLLEVVGAIGRLATPQRSERRLSEMTPAELDEAIAALEAARDSKVVPLRPKKPSQ